LRGIGERHLLNCSIALMILPPILWLLFVRLFGVDVVVTDSWAFVVLIDKFYEGSLTFADLFEPHNEHRIFFPRIIMLTLAHFTKYNKFAEMYFLWALVVVSLLLIYRMYREDAGQPVSALFRFIPVAWLLFSFRQYESILSGFQIPTYLCTISFIFCVYLLESGRKSALLGSVCFGIISTFSFLNGLLVWPIGIVLLLLKGRKQRRVRIMVWAAAGTVAWIGYFYGFTTNSRALPNLFTLRSLLAAPTFFVLSVGSPLAFVKSAASGMGAILCAFILAVFVISARNGIQKNVKWVALILFAIGSSLFFTFGRVELGLDAALASRYVCFTVLGIIGCYLAALNLYEAAENQDQKRYRAMLLGAIVSVILVGVISGYTSGIIRGKEMRDERAPIANVIFEYEKITEESVATRPFEIEVIKERAAILKKHGLNVFRDRPH